MKTIAAWLDELALDQYLTMFEENDIDWETLPELDSADLKEIGITSLGHRKKILRAAAELASPHAKPESGETLGDNERRQITVVFCDLVDSTSLSTKIDAEEMGNVIQRYQDAVKPVINEFGGNIVGFAGDGILSYFGFPVALEHEAERAVRAALKVTELVADTTFYTGVKSQVRIGIATGEVVVGGKLDEGRLYQSMVTGETPNLAARLQGITQPGGIVVCETTRRLAGDFFDYEDLGLQTLKGFDKDVLAWGVIGISENHAYRYSQLNRKSQLPLFGRDNEIAVLRDQLQELKEGTGSCAVIIGDAGIGKSSLYRNALNVTEEKSVFYAPLYCEPFSQNSPFHPIINYFYSVAHIKREDSLEQKLENLNNYLSKVNMAKPEITPYITYLLGLSSQTSDPALSGLSPQLLKEKTIEACIACVIGMAEAGPTLMIFDDLNWADPSTIDFLQALYEYVDQHRIMLVLASRPTESLDWLDNKPAQRIYLDSLNSEQQLSMLKSIAGAIKIPDELVEQVVNKSDGVPLYLEELTKNLLLEYKDSRGKWASASISNQQDFSVPQTLRNSVMVRLDRLAKDKELALICSVIGREFTRELVALITKRDTDKIQKAMQRLVDAEILIPSDVRGSQAFRFRHALVRDAAYDNMLRARRREIHLNIAETLESYYAHSVSMEPERLAHHYTEAGSTVKAIEKWLQAGQTTLMASYNMEAIKHLSKGLTMLSQVEDKTIRDRLELPLQMTLGPALLAVKGFAAREIETTYRRARELCEILSAADELFPITRGLMAYHTVRGEYQRTIEIGEKLLPALEENGNTAQLLELHWSLGSGYMWSGMSQQAEEQFAKAMDIYQPEDHAAHAHIYGQDPGVATMTHYALLLNMMGRYDQARTVEQKIIQLVPELDHAFTMAQSKGFLQSCFYTRQEVDAMAASAEQNIAECMPQGFPVFMALSIMDQGWIAAKNGHADWNQLTTQGMEIYKLSGAKISSSHHLSKTAECYLFSKQIDQGLVVCEHALTHIEECQEWLYQPEVLIIKARLLLARDAEPDTNSACALLTEAVDDALGNGLLHYALTAQLELVNACPSCEQQRADNLTRLQEIYQNMLEGHDIELMQQAKQCLADSQALSA